MSTPAEPALLQTTDLQIGKDHVLSFRLALGCNASWDNTAPPVSLPVYEEYSDVTTSLQTDYDGSMVTDAEKKDAMFKTGAQVTRGRFRHEPYRRLPVNVPS